MRSGGWRSVFLGAALFVLGGTGTGCAGCTSGLGQRALGVIEGPINDPSNRSLRRSILSYGLDVFCREMLRRNAPLKLVEESPTIGRFYPAQCTQSQLEGGDLFVTFQGRGYAYTNLSKKITFQTAGSVRYDQDFQMEGSTMYAFFRSKEVRGSDFRVGVIEQPLANLMNQVNPVADKFGRQLVDQKLAEGFTVIREPNGDADFSMGILPKGQRPVHPFAIHGSGRVPYENLRTEVHQNQRDFIGPVDIEEKGRALYLTATVDGAPAVDVLLMSADAGAQALDAYLSQAAAGPMPPPIATEVLAAGAQLTRAWPVPPGRYFVVLDHTAYAGPTMPPANMLDDRAAVVSYALQIGDAD